MDSGIYRHTTSVLAKKALNIEKRVQAQDRVLSLRDTDDMIRREHTRKGLEIETRTVKEANVAACYKTGWRTQDGYMITARSMSIFNEYVECTYTLSPKYIMQATEVALDIAFERFAIPYEFVSRDTYVCTYYGWKVYRPSEQIYR